MCDFNTQFLVLDTKIHVFDTEFLVFDTEFIIFTVKRVDQGAAFNFHLPFSTENEPKNGETIKGKSRRN